MKTTLKINDEEVEIVVSGTTQVANIENIEINTALGFRGDLSGWTGVSSVLVPVSGNAAAADFELTVDGAAVTINSVDDDVVITDASSVNITAITGGHDVTIATGEETTSVSIDSTAASGTVIIAEDGAAAASESLTTVTLIDTGNAAANIFSDVLSSLTLNDVAAGGVVTVTNAATDEGTLALTADDFDGTLDADNYDTLNVTVDSTSSFDVAADDLVDLSVSGSAGATIAENTALAMLETITLTGEAGLTTDLTGSGAALETVTSTSSGDLDLTIDGGNVILSVTGGDGDDSVEIATAIGATHDVVVDLAAGDDTFTLPAGIAHDADADIDGGAGNDTLAILDGTNVDTAVEAAIFSNFETLEVGGGTNTYELDELGLTDIKASSALTAVVLNDVAAGATLTSAGATASADFTIADIDYILDDATGSSDSMTLFLDAIDGDDDGTADGNVTYTLFTANGVEEVTINATASVLDEDDETTDGTDESTTANEYTHVITEIESDDLETLVLTGDAQIDVTTHAGTASITLVDATANTAGVTVDVSAATLGVAFNGSAAQDSYTASALGDTIQANGGTNAATGQGDLITLAGGDDTVRYVSAADSAVFLLDVTDDGVADVIAGRDVITNFSAGDDIIELSSQLGLATGDARADVLQKGDAGATVALIETFIGDGADFFDSGLVDRATAVFTSGADAYLAVDVNGDGNFNQGGDLLIQLVAGAAGGVAITDISFG